MSYFRIIYRDDDQKKYNVSNIVSDDNLVNKRTKELIEKGRNINVFTTNTVNDISEVPSIEDVKDKVTFDYEFDPNFKW